MSLIALGTAVGGLTKGYKEGQRHFSEMKDAKQARELRGLQIDEAKGKIASRDKAKSIIAEYAPELFGDVSGEAQPAPVMENPAATAPMPAGGIANPGEGVAPSAEAPAPRGLAGPGGEAPPAQPARPQRNRFDAMKEMFSRLNLNAIESGQYSPKEAMELALGMGKKFTDAKTDAALGAMQQWMLTGDQEAAEAALAQAGTPMPAGSTWERTRTELVPGSGMFTDDVKITSPDGKTSFSMVQLMQSRLDPKEFMTLQTDIGFKVADLGLKKEAEANLNTYRQGMLEMRDKELTAQIEHWRNLNNESAERRILMAEQQGDERSARAFRARVQANDQALGTIFQSMGISREVTADKLEMMSSRERQEYQNKMMLGFAAHTIWQMNLSPDNREGISTSEALRIARDAGSISVDKIKTDDTGNAYIKFGNKKVFVPGIGGGEETSPSAPQSADPAQPQARGLTQPQINQQPLGRPGQAGLRTPELPPQAEQAGQQLDAARASYAQALATLRQYGSRQQKADPQGFQQAQAAVAQAEQQVRAAEAAFRSTIPQSMQAPIGRAAQ